MPVIFFSDSSLYLSQLRAALERKTDLPLWFIVESNRSQQSPAGNTVYILWGYVGNLLKLEIFQLYLLMTLTTGLLTWYGIRYLLLCLDSRISSVNLVTSVVAVLAVGFSLGRPSPTQLSLWILLFGLGTVFHIPRKSVQLNFLGVALIFINPSYAIVFLITLSLKLILREGKNYKLYFRLSPLFFSALLFIFLFNKKNVNESFSRFGLFNTHLPGALRISALLICILLAIIVLKCQLDIPWNPKIILSLIGLLVSLNSQIITGKVFESESHFRYLINIFVLISLGNIIHGFLLKKKAYLSKKSTQLLSLLIIITIFSKLGPAVNARDFSLTESNVLENLNSTKYQNKVILIKQGVLARDFVNFIPFNANIYLYWHPDLVFYNVPQKEIVARFACTLSGSNTFHEFISNKNLIYGHKFENQIQFYSKFDFLFDESSRKFVDSEKAAISRDFKQLAQERGKCARSKYKFEADYELLNDGSIRKISKL